MELRELPEPTPGPGEVKVRVGAAGVCGSDIHILHATIKIPMRLPVVTGHEFAGEIVALGEDVAGLQVGQRVTSETTVTSCGVCELCRQGRYNLCTTRRGIGYWHNGAFAECCVVRADRIHPLPDNVTVNEGAMCEPLACCVHAVSELTEVHAGDCVLVTGPGPIGLLAMQVARAEGGRVILLGAAGDAARLEVGKQLGAQITLALGRDDVAKAVSDFTDGRGVDVALECSGAAGGCALGLELLRRGGQFTQIGLFGKPIEVDFEACAYKELTIRGAFSQKWSAWRRALALMSSGDVRAAPLISHTFPLDSWKEAFAAHESKGGLKVLLEP